MGAVARKRSHWTVVVACDAVTVGFGNGTSLFTPHKMSSLEF